MSPEAIELSEAVMSPEAIVLSEPVMSPEAAMSKEECDWNGGIIVGVVEGWDQSSPTAEGSDAPTDAAAFSVNTVVFSMPVVRSSVWRPRFLCFTAFTGFADWRASPLFFTDARREARFFPAPPARNKEYRDTHSFSLPRFLNW